MKKQRRVEQLQRYLTLLQVVMIDIEEAHRHGSMVELARALANNTTRFKRVGTIESMVRAKHRGEGHESIREATRAAQKEAMFLNRLVVESWTSVLCNERAWRSDAVAIGLLHSLVCEMAESEREPVESFGKTLDMWHRSATAHHEELQIELEAVRLIERKYFGGASILFPGDDRMLAEMIGNAEKEVVRAARAKAAFDGAANRNVVSARVSPDGRRAEIKQRAVRHANLRADIARVFVHDRFSESAKADRLVQAAMGS